METFNLFSEKKKFYQSPFTIEFAYAAQFLITNLQILSAPEIVMQKFVHKPKGTIFYNQFSS